ncbi:MAG: outer membrane protein transport protein [Paludibacter sp.]|nr:outer membrane protein transport protein [Paludibacter sp.]
MKRILSIITIALTATSIAIAQSEFDALKFIQPEITGTARYTSMAGAFGALGGDPSAIKDNPAGLGIYRKSELTATLGINTQKTSTSWRNGYATTEGLYKPVFNNLSYVLAIPVSSYSNTNLVQSNFSFSFNRLKNFDRNIRINGGVGSPSSLTDYLAYFSEPFTGYDLYEDTEYDPYSNIDIPWMSVLAANAGLISENNQGWTSVLEPNETVSPYYTSREQGYLNEFAVSWSGNFNNRLFLGATLNFYDLNYHAETEYSETFSLDGYLTLLNTFKSNATGLGLKLGSIYAPLDYLRLGLSLQTPVVYNVKDYHYADLKYGYQTQNGFINDKEMTPEGDNNYKLQGPFTYNLSGSFILGNKAVIGFEYAASLNSGSKFMDINNNTFYHSYENDSIKAFFNKQTMIKIGGEYKLTDHFSIRAGYAFAGPATSDKLRKEFNPNTIRTDVEFFVPNGSTQYLTAGLGYRESNWYIDLAVMNKVYDEKFYAYNSNKLAPNRANVAGIVTTSNINVIGTIGLRF